MHLSASSRISLIREIARRLSTEGWSLIDLTLKQFGLPLTDDWNGGTNEDYVVKMIQSGDDESLLELGQHLGFVLEENTPSKLDPSFWEKGKMRLFISHLATHRKWAAELQTTLLRYGISSFVAHNDIEPTLAWQGQIEMALSTCDALVALLHENFHESKWTDQEIGFAMGRGVPVFSVRFGQDPYGFIGSYQAFNGRDLNPSELALELFQSYMTNKQTQKKMSEVLVNLFESSTSFAEAKINVGYLENLHVWSPSLASRVKIATENNFQIAESFGVPSRVKNLLIKWRLASTSAKTY